MLTHLSIKNFTVVKQLDIDLAKGMTAVTGETGAGKSISLDAISLCLGARGDANMVRTGSDRADIIASFELEDSLAALNWLKDNSLDSDYECIIRRTISAEGRSKAWINGTPVTAQQLKALGQYLVNIHGQHAHLQLLKNDYQRTILDDYSQHPELLASVADNYKALKSIGQELLQVQQLQQESESRLQLLQYQVTELDEFAIEENEFESLEQQHKTLSNSQELVSESNSCLDALMNSDFAIVGQLENYQQRIQALISFDKRLQPISEMLTEASISLSEACRELQGYTESLELDPQQAEAVTVRYGTAMELARKHKIQPEELYYHHQQLSNELADIANYQTRVEELTLKAEQVNFGYQKASTRLSESRHKKAKQLAKDIQAYIRQLNMPHAELVVQVESAENSAASALGIDNVELLLSSNPGQPLQSLHKVASGGELSRIGLAVQVIATRTVSAPTLIFDEVDIGISGATASVVGNMLNQLGAKQQVLCVTHLAQVAANAHQQMFVTKFSDGKTTETQMIALDQDSRVQELARLLGGDIVTDTAIANAKELLGS